MLWGLEMAASIRVQNNGPKETITKCCFPICEWQLCFMATAILVAPIGCGNRHTATTQAAVEEPKAELQSIEVRIDGKDPKSETVTVSPGSEFIVSANSNHDYPLITPGGAS